MRKPTRLQTPRKPASRPGAARLPGPRHRLRLADPADQRVTARGRACAARHGAAGLSRQLRQHQAALAAVMCAYSVVNSIPACQNTALLNTGLYQQAAARGAGAAPGTGAITITNPRGMESRHGAAVTLRISGNPGLSYSATGLPAGLTITPSGLIRGTGRSPGTSTVTVTGKSAAGAVAAITFIWTVS